MLRGQDLSDFIYKCQVVANELSLARQEVKYYRKMAAFWFWKSCALQKELDSRVSVLRVATTGQLISELVNRMFHHAKKNNG